MVCSKRMPVKLLLSAYACNPDDGSEPGVGWAFLKAALQACEGVTVLTRGNNVQALEKALSEDDVSRCRIVGFDLRYGQRLKKIMPAGTQAYYMLWQFAAARRIRLLHEQSQFHLAHHITFASDWANCACASVAGLPYVWGPVGGSTLTPLMLLRYLGVRGLAGDAIRLLSNHAGRKVFGRKACRNAELVLAANRDTQKNLVRWNSKVEVMPNVAIDSLPAFSPGSRDHSLVVGVGRLVPWKGWALALEAVAKAEDRTLRYVHFGEGPDARRLRTKAKSLGISGRVEFRGNVPRAEVLRVLGHSRCMIFPSFHDSSPWAVAEALLSGTPVVALDLGGSGEIVRRAGLTPIAPKRRAVSERLAEALRRPGSVGNTEWISSSYLPETLRSLYTRALEMSSAATVGGPGCRDRA